MSLQYLISFACSFFFSTDTLYRNRNDTNETARGFKRRFRPGTLAQMSTTNGKTQTPMGPVSGGFRSVSYKFFAWSRLNLNGKVFSLLFCRSLTRIDTTFNKTL